MLMRKCAIFRFSYNTHTLAREGGDSTWLEREPGHFYDLVYI